MATLADRLHERFVTKSLITDSKDPDVREWLRFLDNLPRETNGIEKAYNKYLCRMHYFPKYKILIMNGLGFFAEIVAMCFLLFSNRRLKGKRQGVMVLERARSVPDFSDIAPQSLFTEYSEVIAVDNFNRKFGVLCREARALLLKVIARYPFRFFFHYWVFMELAAHSWFLEKYSPEATVVYVNERNVASPIITELYESQGRKLISFMHGEYLLQLVQAHMRFSEYYIWDRSYEDMFANTLRCEADFRVYTPKKLQKKWRLEQYRPEYYCTYYFGDETVQTIYRIAEIFDGFEKQGKRCKVRMHPRDIEHTELIRNVFTQTGIPIENNREISLEQSLGNTRYAVGMQTTVLFESLAEGRAIVIDDVSDPEHFRHLQERRFRLLQSEHILLSELIEGQPADQADDARTPVERD